MEGNPGKHFVISSLPPIPQSTTNLYRCLQITHTIESRFSKVDWDPRLCSHHQHNFDEGPLLIAPDQIKRVVRQKLAQNDVYSFFYKLNQQEEVRYSNDVGNITTERGWSLTWTVKHNDVNVQTIPPIGIAFHRRMAICEVSFDLEVFFFQLNEPSIAIYCGKGCQELPIMENWIIRGPSSKPPLSSLDESSGQKHHFEFSLRDYRKTLPALYIVGFLIGTFDLYNGTNQTQVTISNLVVREKFDHHVNKEWFADWKEGAKQRLSSASLRQRLGSRLPAAMEFSRFADKELELEQSRTRVSNVSLFINKRSYINGHSKALKRNLSEGVNVWSELRPKSLGQEVHESSPWNSYFYRFSEYPAHVIGFVSRLIAPVIHFDLPKFAPEDQYW